MKTIVVDARVTSLKVASIAGDAPYAFWLQGFYESLELADTIDAIIAVRDDPDTYTNKIDLRCGYVWVHKFDSHSVSIIKNHCNVVYYGSVDCLRDLPEAIRKSYAEDVKRIDKEMLED